MPIILDEKDNRPASLEDYQSSFGEYVGAKFDEAYAQNPLTLGKNAYDLHQAEQTGPMLTADDARKRISDAGVKLTVPDTGITQNALDLLIKNQQDNIARQMVIERSPTGARSIAGFGAGVAASLLDPLNVALGFVPVIGQARYTALLAQGSGALSRSAIRFGVGAAEGAVGAAMIEPALYGLNQQLQNDYDMVDSLTNVAFGSVFGGGLHVVAGGTHEMWHGFRGTPNNWDNLKGLNIKQAVDVQKFQSDFKAGKITDVEGSTAGWSDQMRQAAGLNPVERTTEDGQGISIGDNVSSIDTARTEAPFAKLYEMSPENARRMAINDIHGEISSELLANAVNRADKGVIAGLRDQLAGLETKLNSLTDEEFKRRAKEQQANGKSRKESESIARQQIDSERLDIQAQRDLIAQQINQNAKASQAEQALAELKKGNVPPEYEARVQSQADRILGASKLANDITNMYAPPARSVVMMESPETRQEALKTAVAHMAQGQSVNVEPIFGQNIINGKSMSPDQVIASAQRQSTPLASDVADFDGANAATERLSKANNQNTVKLARQDAEKALGRLKETIDNLEASGASPEMLKNSKDFMAKFDKAIEDSARIGRAFIAAATCGLRN